MSKSWVVHYRNKYPGGQVQASDSAIDVYDSHGDHVVALRKNGAGQWSDQSEEFGCKDKHCLAPIPKDARLYKEIDGKLAKDEKYEERMKAKDEYLCDEDRKVLSCKELEAKGLSFDASQRKIG